MIRAVDPPEPTPPMPPPRPAPPILPDSKEDVGNTRIAIHKQDGSWDLVIILTNQELRKVMKPGNILACLVDEVPGFGQVTPICLSFLSARTRGSVTPEQIIMEISMAATKDFVAILPIIITLKHAAALRKHKVVVLGAGDSKMKKREVPAWERLENIVLLLADSTTEIRRILTQFDKVPNVTLQITDNEDESMW